MQIFKQITANNIALTEYKFRKELAMEAYLIENESILQLDQFEFCDVEVLDAEIALKEGRKSKKTNGRIDLLVKYGSEYLGIVELKLEELVEEHLTQLEDYLEERSQILEKFPEFWSNEDSEVPPKWIGVLVGNSAEKSLIEKISNGYRFNGTIPIAIILLNRFKSSNNNEIFVISDTYFKYTSTSKDYTKFKFGGKEYGKGPLVNAVIKEYVAQNPSITFSELERFFPKAIQGSYGVFDTKENAEEIHNRTNQKRHHLNPNQLIEIKDATITTCTQWNPINTQKFINQVHKVSNLKIEVV